MVPRRGAVLTALTMALGLTVAPAGSGATLAAESTSVQPGHVLIYGPSMAPGPALNEAIAARGLGYDVTIADAAAWSALETADFARYDALIIGDKDCSASGSGYLRAAAQTRGRWTPAVSGNVAVLGTDPVHHARRALLSGARRLLTNGLQFATAGSRTGAYIALGCAYVDAPAFTPLPLLRGFGPFTVRGQSTPPFDGCPETAGVVRRLDPLVAGLDSALLSFGGCAIHAGVDSHPYPFVTVAVERPTAMPYLLTRRSIDAVTSSASAVNARLDPH